MLGDTEEITLRTLIWHRRRRTYIHKLTTLWSQHWPNHLKTLHKDTKATLKPFFSSLSLEQLPETNGTCPFSNPLLPVPIPQDFPITGSKSLIVRTKLWYFPMYHPAAANSMHSQSTDIHIYSTSPVICYSSQLWEAFHQWSHARESYTHPAP